MSDPPQHRSQPLPTQLQPSHQKPPQQGKPPPPASQYLIEGARLPWVNESAMKGSREPRK